MARGRKADKGTYEARDYVLKGCLDRLLADEKNLSNEGCHRLIKAVKFGLGIKEEEKTIDKINNVCQKVIAQIEKEIVTPIKEKKATKKESLNNVEGDEYFAPEDCYEANQ